MSETPTETVEEPSAPTLPDSPINDAMDGILKAVNDSFSSYGLDLPERQYKTMGQAAWDDPQLTVSMIQSYYGPAGQQASEPVPCNGPRSGVFQIELVRCIPNGYNAKTKTGPSPDEMNKFSQSLAADAWALLSAPEFVDKMYAVLGEVSVTEPQGGMIAVVLNLVHSYY